MSKKIVTFMSFFVLATAVISTAEAAKRKEIEQVNPARKRLFPLSPAMKMLNRTKPWNNNMAVRSATRNRVKVIEKQQENPFLAENLRKDKRNRRLPKPGFKSIQVHENNGLSCKVK